MFKVSVHSEIVTARLWLSRIIEGNRCIEIFCTHLIWWVFYLMFSEANSLAKKWAKAAAPAGSARRCSRPRDQRVTLEPLPVFDTGVDPSLICCIKQKDCFNTFLLVSKNPCCGCSCLFFSWNAKAITNRYGDELKRSVTTLIYLVGRRLKLQLRQHCK